MSASKWINRLLTLWIFLQLSYVSLALSSIKPYKPFRQLDEWTQSFQSKTRTSVVSALLAMAIATKPLDTLAINGEQYSYDSGMVCATKNCIRELKNCMTDKSCAPGLACLLSCRFRENEGDCQVRCMDLYENRAMEELTECTLTKNSCYPPLPADSNFLPLSQPKNKAVKNFDISRFEGTWYVAAGLNRAFDCFDCQKHDFRVVNNHLEATFTYRIKRDDGTFFTRRGDKRIKQTENSGVLELRLDPNRMNYLDTWTILASDPAYLVVHYHGRNVAWDGYGGLNVYTRNGKIPTDDELVQGIERGLAKVGLTLKDLKINDNSCPGTNA